MAPQIPILSHQNAIEFRYPIKCGQGVPRKLHNLKYLKK